MLIQEIIGQPRNLVATARFKETFNDYRKRYPAIERTLRQFLDFRLVHGPEDSFSSKDSPFSTHNELRGYRHLHLIHGKAILVYQITATELRLCLVTNHDYDTTAGQNKIISFLSHARLEPMNVGEARTLTSSDKAEVEQLLYEFAAEDRAGLVAAINQNFNEILEYIRLVIGHDWSDAEKDRATFAAFGGVDGLRSFIRNVLQRTAPSK